jgi:hypothetical protein
LCELRDVTAVVLREEAALARLQAGALSTSRIQAILHLATTCERHFCQSIISRLTLNSATAFSVVRKPKEIAASREYKNTLVQGRASDSRGGEKTDLVPGGPICTTRTTGFSFSLAA